MLGDARFEVSVGHDHEHSVAMSLIKICFANQIL